MKPDLKRIKLPKSYAAIGLAAVLVATVSLACYKPVSNSGASGPDGGANDYVAESPGDIDDANLTETPGNSGNAEENDVQNAVGPVSGGFRANLEANLKRHGIDPASVADVSNPVESRILSEYGAVFLTKADPPTKVMFTSEAEVGEFQSKAGFESADIGGTSIELQPEAMAAVKKAADEARAKGLSITPRDGSEAGRRSYSKTLDLWNSRFLKALDHWRSKGRLTAEQVSKLKGLPIKQQVAEVLELEKSGIYFNTFFNNSILYSVAAPGTSQHLSMLALDVTEYQNMEVRRILADNGWFRTVQNDEPHFTYLGLRESELPAYGLKKVSKNGGEYWVPDI